MDRNKLLTRFFLLHLFLCTVFQGFAQKTPAIEGWRVHLPFQDGRSLCESGRKVYVGSQSGVFTYQEEEHSLEILSRVNGLSDVDVKLLGVHPASGAVVIVYENANIDIIDGNSIYNISDIYTKLIIGEKRVNNISFNNDLAYLSCSFGIVVIDLPRKTIIDNYDHLGPNGTELEIFDVEPYDGNLYASSPQGLYRASLNSFNLKNYQSWSLFKTAASGTFLAAYKGKLYAVLDSNVQVFDGSAWTAYSPQVKNPVNMEVDHGKLLLANAVSVVTDDGSGNPQVKSFNGLVDAMLGNDNELYTLGSGTGLVANHPNGGVDFYFPSGPFGRTATRMSYQSSDHSLWVAGGSVNGFGTSSGWANQYNNNKFYRFTGDSWINYKQVNLPQIEPAKDFIDVNVDQATNKVYLSSFGGGLFELQYNPDLQVNVYDASNSSLQLFAGSTLVSGSCVDVKGNLWVSNFGVPRPLSARNANGDWFSYAIPNEVDGKQIDKLLGFITCDDNNYKWVPSTREGGIIVYNDNGHPEDPSQHQIRVLHKEKQKGLLPSNTVLCITKDQKGEMWVGTDQGLCIFSNTSSIFRANADYDAHQIVIKTGLVNSNFLGTEAIYCIRVDAANRKWIGTAHGAWLVSEDGYTVIRNFNTGNSPLLANAVYEIGINDHTGEVFFATEKGIISYMGTATEGNETHTNVVVYPNPVKPEYQGLIAIRGLVNDANVKITDISGNLVYETKANGGFATWNGLNFKGKRAATGVYLIYSTNSDATEQWVGKILFIN